MDTSFRDARDLDCNFLESDIGTERRAILEGMSSTRTLFHLLIRFCERVLGRSYLGFAGVEHCGWKVL